MRLRSRTVGFRDSNVKKWRAARWPVLLAFILAVVAWAGVPHLYAGQHTVNAQQPDCSTADCLFLPVVVGFQTPTPTHTPTLPPGVVPSATPTLPPGVTPTATATATATPTRTPTATPTNTPTATPTNTPTPPPVGPANPQIVRIYVRAPGVGQRVEITNRGGDAAAMHNWTLRDGTQPPQIYTFPAFTLTGGATVTVWVKSGTNTATDLYWGLGDSSVLVWSTSGDSAILQDALGIEKSRCTYESSVLIAECQ